MMDLELPPSQQVLLPAPPGPAKGGRRHAHESGAEGERTSRLREQGGDTPTVTGTGATWDDLFPSLFVQSTGERGRRRRPGSRRSLGLKEK